MICELLNYFLFSWIFSELLTMIKVLYYCLALRLLHGTTTIFRLQEYQILKNLGEHLYTA